jgi:hypothetical protein
VINAAQIRGMVCFDIIRDTNGVDWIHDVNPRSSPANRCASRSASTFTASTFKDC